MLHPLGGHAQQGGGFTHLVGEAAAGVQAHDAVRDGHVVVVGHLARLVGADVVPAALHVGDRLQRAGRNLRVGRVGALEMAWIGRALDAQAGLLLAQPALHGALLQRQLELLRCRLQPVTRR